MAEELKNNKLLNGKKTLLIQEEFFLKIPGNFLLFHAGFPRSTIGAMELNFRVRNGIGCCLHAIITGKTFGKLEYLPSSTARKNN